MGDKVGELSEEAADELGLCPGIPVAEGGADAFVGMLGQNVVRSDRISLITGSSHLLMALSEEEKHMEGLWGSYADAVVPGLHMLEGGQTSTGSIVNWFVKNIASGISNDYNKNNIYNYLNKRASQLEPGSEGLILLDYFQGNRTPHTDPKLRGMIWGLSLNHKVEHIYRSILEGISFGTNLIINNFREIDIPVKELVVSGGPTKSDLWMQIHSDVAGVPVVLNKDSQAPALGSAIMAAHAAGVYSSLQEASDNMVHEEKRIEPNMNNHSEYQYYYNKYVESYEQINSLMHEMYDHLN
jgi:ribulose kinase